MDGSFRPNLTTSKGNIGQELCNFVESIWQVTKAWNWLKAQDEIRCLVRWIGCCACRGRFVNYFWHIDNPWKLVRWNCQASSNFISYFALRNTLYLPRKKKETRCISFLSDIFLRHYGIIFIWIMNLSFSTRGKQNIINKFHTVKPRSMSWE
jgi:hypothetical protein